jgi:hypothetical protein
MSDGDTKANPQLSLKQLANLFGFLKTDQDDNIVSIEADYEDDDEANGNAPEMNDTSNCFSASAPPSHNEGNGEGSSRTNAVEIESDNEGNDEVMEDAADYRL